MRASTRLYKNTDRHAQWTAAGMMTIWRRGFGSYPGPQSFVAPQFALGSLTLFLCTPVRAEELYQRHAAGMGVMG